MGGRWQRRLCALAIAATGLLAAGASSAAAPSNDSFSAAAVLTAATGSRDGSNVEATKEAGEPNHADNAGGGSVWYRWVAPSTGTATFDTVGSGFDTMLAVYTGSSVSGLTLVAQNDDFLGWKWTSKVGFAATAGTAYYVAVDGYNDGANGPARGTFALNFDLTPTAAVVQANDNFAGAVQIDGPAGTTAGSSFGATKETGEPNHAGNAGGRSVWFRWTAPYDGTFTFGTDGSDFNTLLAVYSGIDLSSLVEVAANDDIAWNNWYSSVTFAATGGTTYSIALDGKKFDWSGTASGNYALDWSALSGSPTGGANDLFAGAQQLAGASGAASGTTVGAGREAGEPLHAGNPGGASIWFSWTAPAGGTANISTAGSSFDTLLAVYIGSSIDALTQVGANDDIGPGKGPSQVTFVATAGTTYRIAVDGYLAPGLTWAARGDVVLSWSVAASSPPSNDNFGAAVTLTGTGGLVTRSTLGATKEPGEPAHAGNPGGASAWFRWWAAGDGLWRFYTVHPSFNTVLAVYTGDSVNALSLVASNDDVSATDRSSSVTFVARADTTYWIAVDGYRGASGPAGSGEYELDWELLGSDPALPPNDDLATARPITGQHGPSPASNLTATKQAGEPNHAGNPGGASVWFKYTAPSSGPIYFDTPGSSFDTLLAVYTGTTYADLRQIAANDNIQYDHWWPNGQYRESFVSFTAQQGATYYVAVDGYAAAGGAPARGSIYLDWWLAAPSTGATLLAAGDVHAACNATTDDATAQLLGAYPDATIAADGDLADPGSTPEAFNNCYGPTWGAYKSRTRPAVGNHEYDYSPTAQSYFDYFGAPAGAPGKGYYSYELGGWHIVVLNSNCVEVGGCDVGSAEYDWLQKDLAAHVNSCSLAYWHQPLFASSSLATSSVKPFWNLLYQYGADVVVNAHARQYERFAPLTPAGVVDNVNGIREFVVGTGGAPWLGVGTPIANSEALTLTYGVLKLTIRPNAYDWQFLPVAGSVFSDSGHGTCAGGSYADAVRPPSAPVPTATLSATGQFSLSWTASPDIPTGATYGLWRRSTGSTTWVQVASGLTSRSYTFGSTNPQAEGRWVYRVQATGGGKVSNYSGDSAQVIVDKSSPLPPLLKADRTAEYVSGGWWKDQVTVTATDSGDAVLADGTAGSGVNKSTLIAPVTYKTNGTYTVSDQVTDLAGWKSTTASLKVKVDVTAPTLTLQCPNNVSRGAKAYATFSASDAQAGLATPASGSVLLSTSVRGTQTVSVQARDNVGHVTTKSCSYTVR
ncbi:MAG TPA: metallophosphoesterase [Gaiellaceae bacterium]|nr:metallophosphoesterase [Gaiellaceae bacterium]